VLDYARNSKLNGLEVPRKVVLIDKPFQEYQDCMTESFKFRRQKVEQTFDKEIE